MPEDTPTISPSARMLRTCLSALGESPTCSFSIARLNLSSEARSSVKGMAMIRKAPTPGL